MDKMKILQKFKNLNWMTIFNILMIVNLLINAHQAYHEICSNIYASKSSYIGFALSEYLINWKGGYVRRGLIGELLYRLSEATAWPPMPIIITFCIIAFATFAVIFWIMLRKAKIKMIWWIIFLPFTLGGMPIIRKDHLCFLLVLLILHLLKTTFKFLWIKLLCIYVASCLLLHIHEAFFFVIVPFIVFYLYFYEFSSCSNNPIKLFFSTIPLIVPFFLICHYHGDNNISHIIYSSWVKLCPSMSEYKFTTADSIGAIGWTTVATFKMHLRASLLIHNPLSLILIYYLLSRFFVIFNEKNQNVNKEQLALNTILLFQFIMLIPLFTVLSCDVDRICMYWTVSSLCIYCILKTEILKMLSCNEVIAYGVNRLDSFFDYIFKPSKVLLCLLILFITIPRSGSNGILSVANGFLHYSKIMGISINTF